jgi:hypothetical protein
MSAASLTWTKLSAGVLGVFFSLAIPVHATSPRITAITPTGAQRGSEVELRLTGSRIDDAQEIIFYEPGIKVLKIDAAKTNSIKAQIQISADCPFGEYHLRLRTAGGISELRTFQVGPFPVVNEVEPNNASTNAQKIALNTTVSGTIASEDIDCFTVTAKKGERISAEVEGIRLGRGAFDSVLTLQDAQGNVLAGSDDTSLLLQDSMISITAPADGDYRVSLRDIGYGGNNDFVYRLHLGNFPRPTSVYPAGGKAGETVAVKFLGDAKGEFTQSIKLPGEVIDRFGAYAEQAGVFAPSPNWMRVSSLRNVLETEGNKDREHACVAESPPFALNGIVSKKGEVDWFKFKASKGQALDVTVYARKLRSPIDSLIEIFDSSGKSLASNDDASGADSYLKFNPPADGEYFLSIRDQLNAGGADYVYRVEVGPMTPSLTINIPQVARNDSQTRQYIVVPQGNRFASMVAVKRKDVAGDVALQFEGLPSGITMQADVIPAKLDQEPVVFEASENAPIAGNLLAPSAAVGESNQVRGTFRHHVELVPGPNNNYYYSTAVDKLYAAVTEPVPFKIRIVEPKVPLVQYGVMDLKIVAERQSGFNEPITVKMMWNPPGIGSLPDVTIAKGETTADYRLNATGEAQTHKWKIAVIGTATVKGGPAWVSSQLAELEVGDPYLLGKIEPVIARAGETTKLICKLDQKQSFDGKARVKLVGLPEKVTAPEVEITKDSKEATFDLQIDPKVPAGSHKALSCAVDIKKNGETISQTIAPYSVLRIVPPKRVKTASAEETRVAAKSETK